MATCTDNVLARRAYTECGALDVLVKQPPTSNAQTKYTIKFDWATLKPGDHVHIEITAPTVGEGCMTCKQECCVAFCVKDPKLSDEELLRLIYQNLLLSPCVPCAHLKEGTVTISASEGFSISSNIPGFVNTSMVAPTASAAMQAVTAGRVVVWDVAGYHRGVKDGKDQIIGVAYGDCSSCEVVRTRGHLEVGLELPVEAGNPTLYYRTTPDATHPLLGGFAIAVNPPAGYTPAPSRFAIDKAIAGQKKAIILIG
jgi:hypothetical protein